MNTKKTATLVLAILVSLAMVACGAGTESAIATGIAQTQQISELQTAAAGGVATAVPAESTATSGQTSGGGEVVTSRDVNMRAGDSTSYGVMTVVPGGEPLDIIGINAAGTWYQVRYHDAIGWISVEFTTGDKPANLPVATPSAQPSSGGGNSNSNGNSNGNTNSNSGGDVETYVINLHIDDGDQQSVSGVVSQNVVSRIVIRVEFSNNYDEGEVDIAFQCDTSEPENVDISSSGATDNTICNNNWSYELDEDNNEAVIIVELDEGSPVEWTVIANVSP
jgi:SH3-like domain-containing protein